jgi:hypothetical protein
MEASHCILLSRMCRLGTGRCWRSVRARSMRLCSLLNDTFQIFPIELLCYVTQASFFAQSSNLHFLCQGTLNAQCEFFFCHSRNHTYIRNTLSSPSPSGIHRCFPNAFCYEWIVRNTLKRQFIEFFWIISSIRERSVACLLASITAQ